MYTSKNIDVYKGVLSVNTRTGKSICEFAHQGLIYVHANLCYDICIFASMCLYTKSFKVWTGKRGDICEFTQHGFVHESIYNIIYVYLRVFECIQRGSESERSTGCEHMPCQNKTLSRTCKQEMAAYNRTCTPQVQIRGSKCEGSQGQTHI